MWYHSHLLSLSLSLIIVLPAPSNYLYFLPALFHTCLSYTHSLAFSPLLTLLLKTPLSLSSCQRGSCIFSVPVLEPKFLLLPSVRVWLSYSLKVSSFLLIIGFVLIFQIVQLLMSFFWSFYGPSFAKLVIFMQAVNLQ